jgi:VCBS repeat-containing protein
MTTTTDGTPTLSNTPQAVDDYYWWTEDELIASGLLNGNIVTLDAIANDLGGNAKRLWSIDDGNGDTSLADYDLLGSDMGGVWEDAAVNNLGVADRLTISNGEILFDLSASLAHFSATNVDGLAAGDHIHDEFVYAIRLANGVLSQATVTVDLWGVNDAATIGGDATADLTEDDTAPAIGTLTVVDPDHDQSHTQLVSAVLSDSGLGTYSVDGDGHWTYTLDNDAVQYLAAGETATDSFTVTSLDGTASQLVTVTIHGSNDGPVAVADSNAGDPVVEAGNLVPGDSSASGNVLDNDTDPDTNDTKIVVGVQAGDVAGPVSGGVGNSIGGIYGTLVLAADGSWTYTLDNADPDTNALAQDQAAADVFTYTVADSQGATSTATITVAITGSNDAPVVNDYLVTELGEDTQFVGIVVPNYFAINNKAYDPDTDDNANTLAYTFSNFSAGGEWVQDMFPQYFTHDLQFFPRTDFQYLAAGEFADATVSVVATDSHGAQSAPATLTFRVYGSNDAPVLGDDQSVAANEIFTVTNGVIPDPVVAQGTIAFTDVDLSDTHTVTVSLASAEWSAQQAIPSATQAALSTALSASLVDDSTGDGAGTVGWNFRIGNPLLVFLAEGETLTLVYNVSTDDGPTSDTAQVTVTITGANNVPVVTALAGDSAGHSFTETDAGLSASGTVTVFDRDVTDEVAVSVSDVQVVSGPAGGLSLGTLKSFFSLSAASLPADPDSANNLAWTFNSGAEAFNYLAEGEELHLKYFIRAENNYGLGNDVGLGTVTIVINGTNDGPVAVADTNGDDALVEAGYLVPGDSSASGNVLDNDTSPDGSKTVIGVQAGDLVGPVAGGVGNTIAGIYGTLVVAADGSWTYTLDNADPDTNALAQDQAAADVFTYAMVDGQGAASSATLTVAITGSNDAPTLTMFSRATTLIEATTVAGAAPSVPSASFTVQRGDVDGPLPTYDTTGWIALANGTFEKLGTYGDVILDPSGGSRNVLTYHLDDNNPLTDALQSGAAGLKNEVFTVTVADSGGLTASYDVVFQVAGQNDAPTVANRIPDATVAEGRAFDITVPAFTFADVESDPLTLSATSGDGSSLPDWLLFDPSSGSFFGTAPAAGTSATVTVTASDYQLGRTVFNSGALDYHGEASTTFQITVAPTWRPEVAHDLVYGTYGGAHIVHVNADGSLVDTGIFLPNGNQYAYDVSVADVDGDGRQDVLISGDNGSGHLYYNQGGGVFVDSGFSFAGHFQSDNEIADIDNDGDLDLFFQNGTAASALYRNDGAAGFTPVLTIDDPQPNSIYQNVFYSVRFGDLNGDGFADLYVPKVDADAIYLNDGTGHFADAGLVLLGGFPGGVALADFNNDGALDIARTSGSSYNTEVLLNDGSGGFSVRQSGFGPAGGGDVVAGDLDGDGFLDLVICGTAAEGGLQWWKNDGTGQFTFADTLDPADIGIGNGRVRVADFNSDGYADLSYGVGGTNVDLKILLNDGTGNFSSSGLLHSSDYYFFGAAAGILL